MTLILTKIQFHYLPRLGRKVYVFKIHPEGIRRHADSKK